MPDCETGDTCMVHFMCLSVLIGHTQLTAALRGSSCHVTFIFNLKVGKTTVKKLNLSYNFFNKLSGCVNLRQATIDTPPHGFRSWLYFKFLYPFRIKITNAIFFLNFSAAFFIKFKCRFIPLRYLQRTLLQFSFFATSKIFFNNSLPIFCPLHDSFTYKSSR